MTNHEPLSTQDAINTEKDKLRGQKFYDVFDRTIELLIAEVAINPSKNSESSFELNVSHVFSTPLMPIQMGPQVSEMFANNQDHRSKLATPLEQTEDGTAHVRMMTRRGENLEEKRVTQGFNKLNLENKRVTPEQARELIRRLIQKIIQTYGTESLKIMKDQWEKSGGILQKELGVNGQLWDPFTE